MFVNETDEAIDILDTKRPRDTTGGVSHHGAVDGGGRVHQLWGGDVDEPDAVVEPLLLELCQRDCGRFQAFLLV